MKDIDLKPTPEQIAQKAREYLGTPWHHAGRVKGRSGGVDCGGLVYCVLTELGATMPLFKSYSGYTLDDNFDRMKATAEEYGERLSDLQVGELPEPGSILLFRGHLMTHHCGIFTPQNTIVHA